MINMDNKKVYLACGATDGRKQINGLAAIVSGSFSLDPYSEAVFVFCNGSRTRLKVLAWDGDGFWLLTKRLERGRFNWPLAGDDCATMPLTASELDVLIKSTALTRKLKRQGLHIGDAA